MSGHAGHSEHVLAGELRTSGYAVACLTLGLVSLFFCFAPLTHLLAIIFGVIALVQTSRHRSVLGGRAIAIGGLLIATLHLMIVTVAVVLLLASGLLEDIMWQVQRML